MGIDFWIKSGRLIQPIQNKNPASEKETRFSDLSVLRNIFCLGTVFIFHNLSFPLYFYFRNVSHGFTTFVPKYQPEI
jgi:hypothetical protein